MMELRDTIEMMNSSDYKERFEAEYFQALIRFNRLNEMVNKYTLGLLDFTPTCPIWVLKEQLDVMREYIKCLEKRAEIEGITL